MDPDEIPTRDGAVFSGWYTDDGKEYVFSSSTPVTNDITLHAKWVITEDTGGKGGGGGKGGKEPPRFTVSFETNGGSPVPEDQIVRSGNRATQPIIPTIDGYLFDRWYEDNDTFLTSYNFSKPVTRDITLYANWVDPGTVDFDSNGGSPVDSKEVFYGKELTELPDPPTRNGFSFVGWYTYDGLPYDLDTLVYAKITLYARWYMNDDYMVKVLNGNFEMGSNENKEVGEYPQHTVTIKKDYYMAKYEVSQELYQSVMGYNPSSSSKGPGFPVDKVNWYEAVEFCNKLSEQCGLTPVYTLSRRNPSNGVYPIKSMTVTVNWNNGGYRLPTEAEWEYAAKERQVNPPYKLYSGGDNPDLVAWYNLNSPGWTQDVKSKTPNSLGIYNMSGNVWEWCWDWYSSNYNESYPTATDPIGPDSGSTRVLRGGCCNSDTKPIRSVNRQNHKPDMANTGSQLMGFRIVCNGP